MANSWFPHDSTAFSDAKLLRLRARYGWEGYAYYFVTLEWMYQTADAIALRTDVPLLAMLIGKDEAFMEKFIQYCVDIDLFSEDDKGGLFSYRLVEEKAKEREKSIKAKESAERRWKKIDANALRTQSEGNAPPTHPPTNNNVVFEKSFLRWLRQHGKKESYAQWIASNIAPIEIISKAWSKVLGGYKVVSPSDFIELCKTLKND